MSKPILVIGATGSVGSKLVKQLCQQGNRVRGATRTPSDAARRFGSTAEFVEFDYERPETYSAALAGVDRVFLMARPGDEQAEQSAIPLIDEMKRQGVDHVVNLSAYGAESRDDFALRKIELHLEASGMTFTHLRPNWFMQIFTAGLLQMGIRSNGTIVLPAADAQISYIDVRDVASVAAAALTSKEHGNKAFTLTGPQSLDHHEVANAISKATGKTIQYLAIEEEDARKAILAAGLSPDRTERLVGFYRLVRAGACAPVSQDIESILGRPAISFEQFAKDSAACWM